MSRQVFENEMYLQCKNYAGKGFSPLWTILMTRLGVQQPMSVTMKSVQFVETKQIFQPPDLMKSEDNLEEVLL